MNYSIIVPFFNEQDNIFQINDKNGKDYLGNPITYIKPEPEQKKKSVN